MTTIPFNVLFVQRFAAKGRSGAFDTTRKLNCAALSDLIGEDEEISEEEAEERLSSRRAGSNPSVLIGRSTTSINQLLNAGLWEFTTEGTLRRCRPAPLSTPPPPIVSVYVPTERSAKARREHMELRLRRLETGERAPAPFIAPPRPGFAFVANLNGHAIESRALGVVKDPKGFTVGWRRILPGEIVLATKEQATRACATGVLLELTHDEVLERLAVLA